MGVASGDWTGDGWFDLVVTNWDTELNAIYRNETSEIGYLNFDYSTYQYFRVAKGCVPSMKARGGGKIINIASIAGLMPQPGMGVYCVSKAAVLMLTKVMAAELAGDNIQVNAIAPGFIKTKFSAAIWSNPQLNEAVMKQIPQGRMAEPEELTGMALYLASGASSFTTGETMLIDGGQFIGNAIQ
jgi:NAD(P)-dependent dehydrogenase (short-subunit alcohol dehydrogenase family)